MPSSWHYGSVICCSCDVVFMTSSKPAREKSGKMPAELADAPVIALLQKEAAKRRHRPHLHRGRRTQPGLAEVLEAEVIEAYLPKAPTRSEVEQIVQDVVEGLKANGTELTMRQMGQAMKPVTAKIAGRFDAKAASESSADACLPDSEHRRGRGVLAAQPSWK